MKLYIFIILSLLLITSCENPEKTNSNSGLAEIIILSPQNNSELTDMNQKISVIITQLDDYREEREKLFNVSNDTK